MKNQKLYIKVKKSQQADVPYCFILSFLFLNFALEIKLRLFPNGKTQRLYAQGTLLDCAGVSFCGSIHHTEFLYHLFMIITFLKVQKKRKLKQDFQYVCVLFEVMPQYTHSHFQGSVISVDAYLNLHSDFVLNKSGRRVGLRHLTPCSSWSFRWQRRV